MLLCPCEAGCRSHLGGLRKQSRTFRKRSRTNVRLLFLSPSKGQNRTFHNTQCRQTPPFPRVFRTFFKVFDNPKIVNWFSDYLISGLARALWGRIHQGFHHRAQAPPPRCQTPTKSSVFPAQRNKTFVILLRSVETNKKQRLVSPEPLRCSLGLPQAAGREYQKTESYRAKSTG